MFFSLSCYGDHRHLHSFPTRRSSDLVTCWIRGPAARLAERASPLDSITAPLGSGTMKLCYSRPAARGRKVMGRSEEHTSELQSHVNLVCRLLLEKKKKQTKLYLRM